MVEVFQLETNDGMTYVVNVRREWRRLSLSAADMLLGIQELSKARRVHHVGSFDFETSYTESEVASELVKLKEGIAELR
jgi:hypothetical protein